VVPPEDSDSLAAAIAALAGDPPLRAVIGRRSRAFAERCYDRAALAREYRKILDLDSFATTR
jgi:colanic acid biosynthesis glycosyl transferase WcaI